jgi:2-amino-4-hydroxy-6-hydroxymethyldihydropteridine diphosphokinase
VPANTDCVLGVGANLGERERTFSWALEQLVQLGRVTALSNIYENPAVGGPPQPDYLNGAVRLRSDLPALAILEEVQRIERMAGRQRDVHWGPRTLDVDLLWIPDQSLVLPTLQLPHPRLLERPFALLPLLEVAPDAKDPVTRLDYAAVLESHRTDELRLHSVALGPPWRWQRVRPRPKDMASTGISPPESAKHGEIGT